MQKVILLLVITFLFSCGNEPSSPANSPTPTPEERTAGAENDQAQAANPDQMDGGQETNAASAFANEEFMKKGYAKLITGEWEAIGDANWRLKIEGNKINQFKNSELTTSETFTIQIKCKEKGCINEYFWCIATESTCYSVRRVDAKALDLQLAGSDSVTKFVKI